MTKAKFDLAAFNEFAGHSHQDAVAIHGSFEAIVADAVEAMRPVQVDALIRTLRILIGKGDADEMLRLWRKSPADFDLMPQDVSGAFETMLAEIEAVAK